MRRRENTFLGRLRELDFVLIAAALCLTVYGIICVSTAAAYYESPKFVMVQLIAAVIGVVAMLVIALIDYDELLKKFAVLIFIAGLALLLLPILEDIPSMLHGNFGNNENWIEIPFIGINFQPSELVKLMFIVSFGYLLGKRNDNINSFKSMLLICGAGGITVAFVLLEKDLGAAVVFVVLFLLMCFVAKVSLWYFAGALVAGIAASPFLWSKLDNYQQMRILVGFDPTLDPEDMGYQVLQTMRAIANGGLTGMGYGNGTLTHSTLKSTLPARETDVILGVMGEEFGFIGIVIYIILISIVIYRILKAAKDARKEYGSYICVGIAGILIFQTVENIGMCLGLLPVIGLTLPFISYGGSSMLSLYMCLGVVMSIRTHTTKYYFEREKL